MSFPLEDFSAAAGAGGGGTVTSIGGGVGWTPSPDPLIGAGVGDLDIFDLTSETALASGDWFPFVDVSVGTTPASQRRVTLANLLAGLETLGIDADTLDGLDSTAFVQGSGVATRVAYWTSASAIGSDAGLFFDPTSTLLGIGTSVPSVGLHQVAEGVGSAGHFLDLYTALTNIPSVTGRRARGSIAAPAAVQAGDTLFRVGAIGYHSGGAFGGFSGLFDVVAEENFTASAQGARLSFNTTPLGGSANIERMRITPAGNVGIGATAPPALLTVGSGDQFRVSSIGDLVRIRNIPYVWPSAQAVGARVLQNDGAGNLSWAAGGGAGTLIVQEDDVTVEAAATTLDFTEPNAALVTSGPAGEANVNMTFYPLLNGRPGGQDLRGSSSSVSEDLTLGAHAGFHSLDSAGRVRFLAPLRFQTGGATSNTNIALFSTVGQVLTGSATSHLVTAFRNELELAYNNNLVLGGVLVADCATVATKGNAGTDGAFTDWTAFEARNTWRVNGVTATAPLVSGYVGAPKIARISAGVGTATELNAFVSWPFALVQPVGTGCTATSLGHFVAATTTPFSGTVGELNCFLARDQDTATGIVAGFQSQISAGTNRWGVYSGGGASSFFSNLTKFGSFLGATTPVHTVDVTGSFGIRSGSLTLVNGNNGTITIPSQGGQPVSFVHIVGPTGSFRINGIAGGVNGRVLFLTLGVSVQVIFSHEALAEAAANRISCPHLVDYASAGGTRPAFILIYNAVESRWRLIGPGHGVLQEY